MPKIDFLPDNKIFEVESGESILQTAVRNEICLLYTSDAADE